MYKQVLYIQILIKIYQYCIKNMFRLCSDIVRKELLLTNLLAEGRSYQMLTKASLQVTSSALVQNRFKYCI